MAFPKNAVDTIEASVLIVNGVNGVYGNFDKDDSGEEVVQEPGGTPLLSIDDEREEV